MQDLFIELFPILIEKLPHLTAYGISFDGELIHSHVETIAQRLQDTFPGNWIGTDGLIITDQPIASIQMDIAIEQWQTDDPDLYGKLKTIDEDMSWQATGRHIAEFVYWTSIMPIEAELRHALATIRVTVANGTIERGYTLHLWDINYQPALSLTIQSQVVGDEILINSTEVQRALNLRPDARSQMVKMLSDILKSYGIIDNAYNSRVVPELFLQARFEPSIAFANNKSRDFEFDSLAVHFQQYGLYARHKRFDTAPIKIAIINSLDEPIDDFVEALRRALERNYNFKIEMLRERKVRVISDKNLESAVRVVEKEDPHIVLAFLPDTNHDNLDSLDPNFQQVKSLALGKGIASHAIYRKTVHDPDSMPRVMMGILGKTGNLPYVLAEPLPYADMVVGMDMVRQELTQFDRVTAMARIYDNVGRGMGYIMETVELDSGDTVPFIVMQALFPAETFGGKRVIVHRHGAFSREELSMLARWEQVIGTTFFPIAIETKTVPHLYRFEKKTIRQPDWGTMFVLNNLEAFIVTTTHSETLPMPLYVRAPSDLGIEYGLHSVLMWTLLHYGASRPARLPVTIQYADEMQGWMSRGQLPAETAGDVPFWL